MGDGPDHRYAGSDWVAGGEETAAGGSGAVATADTGRWLLDQPRAGTFVPSRREVSAVDTYCAELCPPSEAAAASGEVLETFTGAGPADLLAHTRVVAAAHTATRREQSRFRRRREQACDSTPGLLAARANHTLGDAEAAELDAHVSSCLQCQALELRSQRAERSFAAILAAGVEQDVFPTAVADAPAHSGDTTRWLPDAAVVAAAAAEADSATTGHEMPVDERTRRRRLVGAGIACAGVVAATIAAIVLITGSNNSHHVASTQLAAVHHAVTTAAPAHHAAAKHHARAHKHAAVVHHIRHTKAHRTATTAPATPASTPPPVTSTPVVSQPASTPPSTPVTSQPSTPAPSSQQIVSVQQPSLGAVNAPTQRVGSK